MIDLADIRAARDWIAGSVVRTPLVRLHMADAPAEIYLKLENLQPINSFKLRGATNAIMLADPGQRMKGLVTASAGNMARGVAWTARQLGLPATIAVPEHAPEAKLTAISAHARRTGPGHRRRRGRARPGGRADRPGRPREDRVRGIRRQYRPDQLRGDPRRRAGIKGANQRQVGRSRRGNRAWSLPIGMDISPHNRHPGPRPAHKCRFPAENPGLVEEKASVTGT